MRNLADASAMVDKLPWRGIFLLDREPTVAELSQSFAQTTKLLHCFIQFFRGEVAVVFLKRYGGKTLLVKN